MKAYKWSPAIKSIMLQQTGQMRVTRVVFSESPYKLIVKYVFCLLLVDCCMKLVFLLFVIMCAIEKMWVNWWKITERKYGSVMQKKLSELMKNNIEKYGSNGSYGCNGNNGSNGKNDVDNKEFPDLLKNVFKSSTTKK